MSALRFASRGQLASRLRTDVPRIPQRNSSTGRPYTSNRIRTGLLATTFVLSTGLFAVYYFDSRSSIHRYVLTPLVRNLFDAETSHKIAVKTLRAGLGPRDTQSDDEILKCEVRLWW